MTESATNSRVILYYNGAISALTLFVQHPDAGVCTPCPLPVLSEMLDADTEDNTGNGQGVQTPASGCCTNKVNALMAPL